MFKLCWKPVLVSATAGMILVFVSLGCGGSDGGGGGPTAPTIADVAGTWSGDLTLESASGCGCIGSVVQLLIGFTMDYSMEITQNGSAAQGRWTSAWSGESCDFTGTVGSESLGAEATGCGIEVETDVQCLNGNRRDLHWTGATLQASVFGNDMTGTVVETWDCFHSMTGDPKGTLTLQGRIAQTRG